MPRLHGTLEMDSPVGRLLLVASRKGLTHLLFLDRPGGPPPAARRPVGDGSPEASRVLAAAETQLREYFAVKRREFDVPLAPVGTAFQMAVWRGLRDIPFGETESYGGLARRIGRPKAVRAVGAANAANPISIIVPCHRVVGHDGRLTGFGGGLRNKKILLELEGATVDGDRLV